MVLTRPYVGRFAPTPSGALHLGSLVAALASYLDAKSVAGRWLVRIEDLDPPRQIAGAADNILRTLEGFGFEWDDEVLWQSKRSDAYEVIISKLINNGLAYACSCSRKQLVNNVIYPNTCRDKLKSAKDAAIRVRTPNLEYQFEDRVQGLFTQKLAEEVGDFIIKRRDGLIAYQLAVVLDDAEQGINHVVRGADLLGSTPRQIYLQELLGFPMPNYLHIPTLVDSDGYKLSKSHCSPFITTNKASQLLVYALQILGQKVEKDLVLEPPLQILNWAITHWQSESIPKKRIVMIEDKFSITTVS